MKIVIICSSQPNQLVLSKKISELVDETILITVNTISLNSVGKKTIHVFFRKILLRIFGYSLVRAWSNLQKYYSKIQSSNPPFLPKLEVSDVNDPRIAKLINDVKPDLVAVSGTNIIRRPLIKEITKTAKIMNLHTGISPYVKGGPNCTNWCLALGEFGLIGNTVMWLDAGIDSGNIIATERVKLSGTETLSELHLKVMEHAHDLYVRAILSYLAGKKLKNIKQSDLGKGRLFYNKQWNAYQAMKAFLNFKLKYSSRVKAQQLIPLKLVNLELCELALQKISIVLPDFTGGGAERVSLSLAQAFVERGYRVDFVLMRATGELLSQVPEGARVVDLHARQIRNVPRAFANYLKREKPDAIIANMWSLTVAALLGHRLARSKARIVVSDHNMLGVQYADKGALHAAALRASLALTYPLADGCVGVSGGVVDGLVSLSGLSRQRFTVIHNPIPVPNLSVSTDMAEKAWQGWRGKRIITVGRLKTQKNHALLIRSFKRLLKETEARLMILGTGDLEAQMRELIGQEGLINKVLMPGHVLDPAPFYRSADLFVLSSDREGLPTVLIEALACGTPVVSTDCPSGPAEILQEGRYGTLVPVGDEQALAKAMVNALNTRHDHDALKRRAADFAPEIAARKYLDLLFPDEKAGERSFKETSL